jgi:hypothetical protein
MCASSIQALFRGAALLGSGLFLACAQQDELGSARGSASYAGATSEAGAGAGTSTGGAPTGGTAGMGGNGGSGLSSDVFGSSGVTGSGGSAAACDYGASAICDWTRVEGCCSQWACEKAAGADVFNTYPVESCQALVACVNEHSGCSNAADPLCFQNENPAAPCLNEAYQASHTDPEGPFAWTVELVNCVCGY